jgi:hypothetical protein
MNTQTTLHGLRALGLALIAGLVVCAPAQASGGGHFGAVGHAGVFGFRGGGVRGFAGFRGGFGCCFWPGYGLFLATLPFYYSTLWWNGVPYYYADDNYYVWNHSMSGYQAVAQSGRSAVGRCEFIRLSQEWPEPRAAGTRQAGMPQLGRIADGLRHNTYRCCPRRGVSECARSAAE